MMNELKRLPKSARIILGICIVVFVIENILSNFILTSPQRQVTTLILTGGMYNAFVVAAHEYWRLFTAGFIHIDILHLLMNMLAFISLARPAKMLFTEKKMLIILFVSIICGSVAILLFSENTITVGLSGGLFGLLGASLMALLVRGDLKNPAVRSRFIQTLLINAVISFMPGVSLFGHLGGLIGGLYLGLVYSYSKPKTSLRLQFHIVSCVLVIFLGIKIASIQKVEPIYLGNDLEVVDTLKSSPLQFYGEYLSDQLLDFYNK